MNNEEIIKKCSKCKKVLRRQNKTGLCSYHYTTAKLIVRRTLENKKIKEAINLAREDERQKINDKLSELIEIIELNEYDKKITVNFLIEKLYEIFKRELKNQSQDAVKSTPQDGSKTTGSDKTLLDISNERQKLAKEIFDELDKQVCYEDGFEDCFSYINEYHYREIKQKYLGVKE